jgi:hypothetical protein
VPHGWRYWENQLRLVCNNPAGQAVRFGKVVSRVFRVSEWLRVYILVNKPIRCTSWKQYVTATTAMFVPCVSKLSVKRTAPSKVAIIIKATVGSATQKTTAASAKKKPSAEVNIGRSSSYLSGRQSGDQDSASGLPEFAGAVHFVNADLFAGGLSPLKPELASIAAARTVPRELDRMAGERLDFVFVTASARPKGSAP